MTGSRQPTKEPTRYFEISSQQGHKGSVHKRADHTREMRPGHCSNQTDQKLLRYYIVKLVHDYFVYYNSYAKLIVAMSGIACYPQTLS